MNAIIVLMGISLSLLPGTFTTPKIQIQPAQIQKLTSGFPEAVSLSRQLGEIRNQVKAIEISA